MPSIKQAAETMLNNVILPFWMRLKDEEQGGYYGLVAFDLPGVQTAQKRPPPPPAASSVFFRGRLSPPAGGTPPVAPAIPTSGSRTTASTG